MGDGMVRSVGIVALLAAVALLPSAARADDAQIERGKYLARIGDCVDCHTPGYFFGKPDMTRYLGGSDVGFRVGDLGVFVGPNLTPDKETGLGNWTAQQIEAALTTGLRPDGRILAPIMPWRALAGLTRPDLVALVAYLRSLPPVEHKVPGPFGPDEKPGIPAMTVVMPEDASPGK
jgi:mono/diheme cytochrome c family protein